MSALMLRPREDLIMRDAGPKTKSTPFAQWLYDNRRARGWTLVTLADHVGVSHSRIVQLEKGDEPTIPMVRKIGTAFAGADADDARIQRMIADGTRAAFGSDDDRRGPIETIISEAGYDPDILDDEEKERLRGGIDALIVGTVERQKRERQAGK